MPDHPFGLWSLLPPVLAITLAIVTRRVVMSLFLGVAVGALLLAGANPLRTIETLAVDLLWKNLIDIGHLQVFAFTLMMGAMVGVMNRAGGMHGVVERLAPLAYNRRRGQLVTWVMGLAIFFDDYANTLLLGGTMRPLTDRLRISREKLAFLVDSTAAPVAGLAVISTWVAGEIGYIETGLQQATLATSTDGMTVFIATIPYRFYVLLALAFVFLVAWLDRDFGPMLTAERRVAAGGRPDENAPALSVHQKLSPDESTPRRWPNALVPIVVTIATILFVLGYTGAKQSPASAGFFDWLSAGDSYWALVVGSFAGLVTVMLLAAGQRLLSPWAIAEAAMRGAVLMLLALMILWMAWSLADLTGPDKLQTGTYLGSLLTESLDVRWMPTVVFVLASAVAFATGTSWGTMGILTPLVISVTSELLARTGSPPAADDPLLLASIGSVLAGAIFGDHCSPISDTTVLSSQASSCDHIAHVWTQMPYALTVAAVAILCGTLPVGWGFSPWPLLVLGIVTLALVLRFYGKQVASDRQALNAK